jgi:GT2 family glycosyltransferase
VIVVNYNGHSRLADCLHSLCADQESRISIIVVDNASTDRSWKIAGHIPCMRPLTMLKSDTNRGYGVSIMLCRTRVQICGCSEYGYHDHTRLVTEIVGFLRLT